MKNIWETYKERVRVVGDTVHDVALNREERMLKEKMPNSLSFQGITIDGVCQNLAVINSDNLNEKTLCSIPGEDIKLGGLVDWMNNFWLVTEKDANSTVYVKAKMTQCNHMLKWIDSDGVIHEQWCIVEDGTKYLTGEYEDRNFVVTRGDTRLSMTIARNEHTVKFCRRNRFLIDDTDAPMKLSYELTKPLKVGSTYKDEGVYKFVLQEVESTDMDNHELGIADYYKYFHKSTLEDSGNQKDESNNNIGPGANTDGNEPQPEPPKRKVWL